MSVIPWPNVAFTTVLTVAFVVLMFIWVDGCVRDTPNSRATELAKLTSCIEAGGTWYNSYCFRGGAVK